MSKFVSVAVICGLVSGCAGMPASGPSSNQIVKASIESPATSPYDIIDIDTRVADIVARRSSSGSRSSFSRLPSRSTRGIGVGDTVVVTMFESQAGGLFSQSSDENTTGIARLTLPPQVVDRSGTISVPYAGSIPAAGRTPKQVQREIEAKLSKRAIEPQAVVSIMANESRLATVTGDVEKGGRVALPVGTETLLDAIALAGGSRATPADTMVKLTRRGSSGEMRMSQLVASPQQNVRVEPGDQIYVYQHPQTFVALGASTTSSEIKFDTDTLTLSEALGRMGGLDDRRADPGGIFVFRYESAGVADALGSSLNGGGPTRPIVYRLDLKKPASFLAAQRFPVKDRDVVYLANSPSTELAKFLGLLGAGAGTAATTTVVAARIAP